MNYHTIITSEHEGPAQGLELVLFLIWFTESFDTLKNFYIYQRQSAVYCSISFQKDNLQAIIVASAFGSNCMNWQSFRYFQMKIANNQSLWYHYKTMQSFSDYSTYIQHAENKSKKGLKTFFAPFQGLFMKA